MKKHRLEKLFLSIVRTHADAENTEVLEENASRIDEREKDVLIFRIKPAAMLMFPHFYLGQGFLWKQSHPRHCNGFLQMHNTHHIPFSCFCSLVLLNCVVLVWEVAMLKHRGPDWSGLYHHGDCFLAHQRLAIIDPASGDQPLYNKDKTIIVTVNGEIYNHEELRKNLANHKFRTGSDCEVIAHLYEEYGDNFMDMLDGIFSFVLLDTHSNSFIAARDAIRITPLYVG